MSGDTAESDALRSLASDWQANGNSRPLGDPTAATWHECALQLLRVLDAEKAPPARRMDSERRRVSHPYCGSIQCAECHPHWGEHYNNATCVTPPDPTEGVQP